MGLTPETVTQRRISSSPALFSLPEGSFSSQGSFVDPQPRREMLVQEKIARKACAAFLLTERRLAQFGSSIVDFNGLSLIDQPYSLRESRVVPPRRTLDRLYRELWEEAGMLPNERQRVHLRANIRAASSWCDLVEGVSSGIPQDFRSELAAQYDFPNTLRTFTPFPREIINASVRRLRSIVRDASFGGFSPDERGRAGIMRRHEGMRIFPLSYWNVILEQTQQMQQIPKVEAQLPKELAVILHWGYERCRNDILRSSDKVIRALNQLLDVKIAGVGVNFEEKYEDDYWTCRTSLIKGAFQLKLNTRRLLYIHMGRVEHLGGHELACHFGAVKVRAARYDQLSRAGSHLEDTDIYLPDLISMLPSPQQVMEEGLAEMYSKFLPEDQQVAPEARMAQDFTLNELIASHGLYYNAQLLMEQAGDDQESRNAVKREQAKNIAEELMVSRREAYDELNYRDYRAFATPRDIVRAWRAALYRPAYAMGVLLMELTHRAFSALPPDECMRAKREYINYLVTRGTTPELMIEKAAELSGGKLNPETARRSLYT